MSTNHYLHSAQQWGRDGEQLILAGERIFVRHRRQPGKPVLLLLHGFPSSSWDWQPLWEPLGEHFELLALDLLGFGFSAKPNRRDYSIHRQADIVEALVAANRSTTASCWSTTTVSALPKSCWRASSSAATAVTAAAVFSTAGCSPKRTAHCSPSGCC